MYKGGYRMVDLHGVDIIPDAETAATVPGTYAAIEGAHRKAILITGFVVDGVEQHDHFLNFWLDDGVYTAMYRLDEDGKHVFLTINDDDEVELTTETGE